MGSSKTGVTDSSATESDGAVTKTDSDVDIDDDGDCDFDCPPNTDSCPFLEGEKVLAFHNLCVYEAKVLSFLFSVGWVLEHSFRKFDKVRNGKHRL
jgi:hypothetical protein